MNSNSQRHKWNRESVIEESRKYRNRTDFSNSMSGAFNYARKHNMLDEMVWLDNRSGFSDSELKDSVYAYFFNDLDGKSYVYVGRSIQPSARDKSHRKNKKDTVYMFSKENNIEIPPMCIIDENLSIDEGCEKEDFYLRKFESEGYIVLNKAKTGRLSSSCGPIGKDRLTYEICRDNALKCHSLSEYRKNYLSCYSKSLKKKWLNDFTWLVKLEEIDWTFEMCEEIARKYTDTATFARDDSRCFNICRNRDYFKLFPWIKSKKQLTEEKRNRILELSRSFTNTVDFRNAYPDEYSYALNSHLINVMTWLERTVSQKRRDSFKRISTEYRNTLSKMTEEEKIMKHEENNKKRKDKEIQLSKELEAYDKELKSSDDGTIWKDIPGYEGLYQAGTNGMIRSIFQSRLNNPKRIKILSQKPSSRGVIGVALTKNGVHKRYYVHVLIAMTFLDFNKNDNTDIVFIDGNKLNTRLDNLMLVEHDETAISSFVKAHGKPVLQFDMEHNLIAEYPSVRNAARHIGADSHSISDVLHGRGKSCKGFLWEFKK